MRVPSIRLLILVAAASGCSVQRAMTASSAREQMVGMPKEKLLACMGPAQSRALEGETEVWSYNSGGGTVGTATSTTRSSGTATTTGSATAMTANGVASGVASGTATANGAYAGQSSGFTSAVTRNRYCVVNIVIRNGAVAAVNYVGNTGGLVSQGSECAYAVQNCVN